LTDALILFKRLGVDVRSLSGRELAWPIIGLPSDIIPIKGTRIAMN
jgi:hypothetical protein